MKKLTNELKVLKDNLNKLDNINLDELNLSKTSLYIVDMNNGFAKGGALYSPRVENLINPIANLANYISNKAKSIIAFTDCHNPNSIELNSYPTHCMNGDIESEIVDELKSIKNIEVIPKNSTNGFFALKDTNFDEIDNIIIAGDCTDICIYQFAITLKSYFNENNINKDIIVPMSLVDTYDIENVHCAELLNIVFLNSLIQNGVKVVKNIIF